MMLSLRLPLDEANIAIPESFVWNATMHIDGDSRVFLTVPYLRTDDRIYTSISVLTAGQLEVALEQVHVEYASPKKWSDGNEMSDGPTSHNPDAIRGGLELLGKACATARLMLIAAAADRWGTNPRSCHAHEGEVIHTATWRKFKYGELATDAAYRPIPDTFELPPTG